jgi:hypothetical protein
VSKPPQKRSHKQHRCSHILCKVAHTLMSRAAQLGCVARPSPIESVSVALLEISVGAKTCGSGQDKPAEHPPATILMVDD